VYPPNSGLNLSIVINASVCPLSLCSFPLDLSLFSLLTLALTLHSISLLLQFQKTPHKTPQEKNRKKTEKRSLAERFIDLLFVKIPAFVCCIPAQNSQFSFSHRLFLPSSSSLEHLFSVLFLTGSSPFS
jgi:hypothetical protein